MASSTSAVEQGQANPAAEAHASTLPEVVGATGRAVTLLAAYSHRGSGGGVAEGLPSSVRNNGMLSGVDAVAAEGYFRKAVACLRDARLTDDPRYECENVSIAVLTVYGCFECCSHACHA
jgi:hypothetical protein